MKLPQLLLIISALVFTPLARGQMLLTLYEFQEWDRTFSTNIVAPTGLVEGSDGKIYGTTYDSVFSVSPNGGSFMSWFVFAGNGEEPVGELVQVFENIFYGATIGGGASSLGTIYQISVSGEFSTLVNFDGTNGEAPSGLTLGSDGNFYGTTQRGGIHQTGSIFKMTPEGELTTLLSTAGHPVSGVIQGNNGFLYGTTIALGGHGSVFRVMTNGNFVTLALFNGRNGSWPQRLVQGNDGHFYGTTLLGGSADLGTAFRMTTNGSLKELVSFKGANGSNPSAGLIQATDGNFYGTTFSGGSNNLGTVFKMTKGGALTTLITFNGTNGANPTAKLIQGSDGHLYGTTSGGGSNNLGTVFRIVYPPIFAGLYNGLFHGNGSAKESSGFFSFKVTKSMKFSGKFYLDGLKYPVAGQFESDPVYTHIVLERAEQPDLDVYFHLMRMNGTFQVQGAVMDSNWVSYAFGGRADYSRAMPCPQEGSYAMTFWGQGDGTTGPNHGSHGIATVGVNGMVRLKGILADDTRIVRSAYISADGDFSVWPLYVPLYPQANQYRGLLTGPVIFVKLPELQMQGGVTWIKPAMSSKYYSAGITNLMGVLGSIRE